MRAVGGEGHWRGEGGAGREVPYNTFTTSRAHTASYSETRALHLSPHQQVHVASFGGGSFICLYCPPYTVSACTDCGGLVFKE